MAVARNDAGTPNVANASATTLDLTTFVPLVGPATQVQTKTVLTCGQAVQVLAQRLYEFNVAPGLFSVMITYSVFTILLILKMNTTRV